MSSLTSLSLLNAHFDIQNKDESCYAFITVNGPIIEVTCVDAETGKMKFSLPFTSKDLKEFMDNFKFTPEIYKAIIVDSAFLQAPMYPNVMDFCKELKQKLNERKIPNYFITKSNCELSCILTATNIKANFGETVYLLMSFTKWIRFAEFKYTSDGYQLIKNGTIKIDPKKRQDIFGEIFGTTKPKNVIAWQDRTGYCIKKMLKNVKMIILYRRSESFREKFMIETCKWILDKSYTKFHILPFYDRSFIAFDSLGSNDPNEYQNGIPIMSVNLDDQLPIKKSAIFPRSTVDLILFFFADTTNGLKINYHYKPELKRNCHRFQLNMDIDEECFETFKIEQIILDPIKALPSKLDKIMEVKIPVIGFFDNSSIICVYKDENYQFLEEYNGMYGTDHFISFDKKKPKYGQAAMEMLSTKASSVVYDILKIMSMPPDKININKAWQFTITKDCDNPVLIEFDDDKGCRSAASPAFLMAMLIKQYLKAVKKENGGEKPTEIAFWILNDENKFDDDEMKRIKVGLEESSKLLKIKCSFIDC